MRRVTGVSVGPSKVEVTTAEASIGDAVENASGTTAWLTSREQPRVNLASVEGQHVAESRAERVSAT